MTVISVLTVPLEAWALNPAEAQRAIDEKYASLPSDVTDALGWPTSEVQPAALNESAYKQFEGGRIYFNAKTKEAHFVIGDIYWNWTSSEESGLGLAETNTGLPLTDELPTPDGRGRFQHFAWNASYYWTPEFGAYEVDFDIRDAWAAQGWELGPAGYPVGDAMPSDGRCGANASLQEFEYGFFCHTWRDSWKTWFVPYSP